MSGGRGVAMLSWALLAGAAEPTPDQVRRSLSGVFEREEFNPPGPNRWGWLLDLLAWLGGLREAAPVLFWIILIVCIAVLVFLLAHIAYIVSGALGRGRRAGDDAAAEAARRLRQSAVFKDAADRAAAAGDLTEAARCLFLSLVYYFDESGKLAFQPARTNREYLDGFADRPTVHRGLRVFVDTLDDNWYGQRPTAPPQFATCRATFDDLRRGR